MGLAVHSDVMAWSAGGLSGTEDDRFCFAARSVEQLFREVQGEWWDAP